MIRFPRLKTFLSVFPLTATTWGVRGGADEVWRIKLTDERAIRALGALLPYLNGETAADDILQSLEGAGIHRGAASAVLRQLEATSLIEDAGTAGLSMDEVRAFDGQIRYFSRFTQEGGARLQARLRDSRAGLVADGPLGGSMYGRLAGAGFGEVVVLSHEPAQAAAWTERVPPPRPRTTILGVDPGTVWPDAGPARPELLVVCQETHDPLLLEAVDALSKRHRLPWLLVRNLDPREGWVGPLFVPGETASYLSLEARQRANMPRYPEYLAFDAHVRANGRPPMAGGLHAAADLLASIAVIEAIKFLTEFRQPELLGKFLTIDLLTWETELHEVLRMPALDRSGATRPPVFPWKTSHEDGALPSGPA